MGKGERAGKEWKHSDMGRAPDLLLLSLLLGSTCHRLLLLLLFLSSYSLLPTPHHTLQ